MLTASRAPTECIKCFAIQFSCLSSATIKVSLPSNCQSARSTSRLNSRSQQTQTTHNVGSVVKLGKKFRQSWKNLCIHCQIRYNTKGWRNSHYNIEAACFSLLRASLLHHVFRLRIAVAMFRSLGNLKYHVAPESAAQTVNNTVSISRGKSRLHFREEIFEISVFKACSYGRSVNFYK